MKPYNLADFVADRRVPPRDRLKQNWHTCDQGRPAEYLNQQENRAYQAMVNRLKPWGQRKKLAGQSCFVSLNVLYDGYLQN